MLLLVACPRQGASTDASDTADPETQAEPAEPLPGWGIGPPALVDLAKPQLDRNVRDETLAAWLHDEDPQRRAQAVWSALRIDGRHGVDLGLEVVARGAPAELGAAALLEPPRLEAGGPGEPVDAWSELEDALWTRYAVTDDLGEAQSLLLAIGRTGGSASVTRLAVDLAHLPRSNTDGPAEASAPRWEAGMRTLGVLCARGHALDELARDAVGQGLGASESELRATTAWTLWRCVPPSAEVLSLAAERKVLVDRLARLLENSDAEASAAWKSFAALGELPEPLPVVPLQLGADGRGRRPWWVEVEAVRALTNTSEGRTVLRERLESVADAGLEHHRGPRAHVLLEILRAVRPHVAGDDQLSMALEKALERLRTATGASKRDSRLIALARCEAEATRATKTGDLTPLDACGAEEGLGPDFAAALVVEALLDMGDAMPREERIAALVTLASDRRPERAAPALAALAEVDDDQAKEVLRRALDRRDPGVLAAAAGAIAARSVDASRRDPAVVPVLTGLVARTEPELVEARLAAIEALGALGRSARTGVAPGSGTPPETDEEAEAEAAAPWLRSAVLPLAADANASVRRRAREALLSHDDLVVQFDAAQSARRADPPAGPAHDAAREGLAHADTARLRFVTDAGEFVVRLGGGGAPINQGNVARLAKEKFYDGLRFHRVVPGFVVQGGDPRGDGYGGPGFLMPCEYANVHFDRGVVGIATAGMDTGGSQLFITQTPQPHLDARYTAIGVVESGMDVVDAILPHDRILRVEVERG